MKKAKTKKQISNIEIFSKIINYLILLVVALSAVFSNKLKLLADEVTGKESENGVLEVIDKLRM